MKKSKKVAAKKSASKKVAAKKSAPKKVAAKKTPIYLNTGNKVLNEILQKITEAKEGKKKTVVVFTTNETHYKENGDQMGFGSSDLKPNIFEAYKTIFCQYNVSTSLVDATTKSVNWIVTLK